MSRGGRLSATHLLEQVRVVDVMSSPAVVTVPGDDVSVAAARMREHRIGDLPVVDGRQLVGILTETDLLRLIVDADAQAPVDLTEIVVAYP